MPIYKLTAKESGVELHIRAACHACARTEAAWRAGPEGLRVWRDPVASAVELLENPEQYGYQLIGKRAILKRETHGGQ